MKITQRLCSRVKRTNKASKQGVGGGWRVGKINKPSLNIRNTSFMIFLNEKFEIPEIMSRNESLSYVEKMKFLVVVLHNKLKFAEHISNVCNKISKLSFIFNKLSYIVPPNILRTMYFSLFYPHITYATEIWGNSNKTQLKRLRAIQNRLVAIINDKKFVSDNCSRYKLLKFDDIYDKLYLVKFYSFAANDQNSVFSDLASLNSVIHSYPTRFRESNNINIPHINCSCVYSSFFITL